MKRVHHRGEDWEAASTGAGHGVGAIAPGERLPAITSWQVAFRCISDPSRPVAYGHSHLEDVANATPEELRELLAAALADH
jgi:hypothetical protein